MRQRDFGGALLAALLFAACGGAAVPAQKLTSAKASIRGAHEVGAANNPRAALHLKLARDRVAQAERLIEDGDNEEAALALNQAQADADLALALTREQNDRKQAEQAKARVAELRSQAQNR
ncbi:MAG TPA: DUF4398 domain-containing protein [Polyangiaceae bacterium]|jgi:hypothetical protein|nr:DUF4398 domain-containing protein [Polyangiaceae bacterium]